jgi:hypothetical protein
MNPVERQHQSLGNMMKTGLREAGFKPSMWPHFFKHAICVKNRVYNKSIQGIPYEKMFAVKPDLHHLRVPGAIAYVHVPDDPQRTRDMDNAAIGFVLGMEEGHVGYKIYFPHNNTFKWASDVVVDESIMYKDRHDCQAYIQQLEELRFTTHVPADEDDSTTDEPTLSATMDYAATGVDASVIGDAHTQAMVDIEGPETMPLTVDNVETAYAATDLKQGVSLEGVDASELQASDHNTGVSDMERAKTMQPSQHGEPATTASHDRHVRLSGDLAEDASTEQNGSETGRDESDGSTSLGETTSHLSLPPFEETYSRREKPIPGPSDDDDARRFAARRLEV